MKRHINTKILWSLTTVILILCVSKNTFAENDTCSELFSIGIANIACFGADGADGIDDTSSIKDAVRYARENNSTLFFPIGEFIVSEPFDVSGMHVSGLMSISRGNVGARITVNKDIGENIEEVFLVVDRPAYIENLIINCNHKAKYGIKVTGVNEPATIIERVGVGGADIGIYLEDVQVALLEKIGGGGLTNGCISLKKSSQVVIDGLVCSSVRGAVILAEGDSERAPVIISDPSRRILPGIRISNVDAEIDDSHVIVVRNVKRKSDVEYLWVEGAAYNGLWLDNVENLRFSNSRFLGSAFEANKNFGVAITGDSKDDIIEGVGMHRGGGDGTGYEAFAESTFPADQYPGNSSGEQPALWRLNSLYSSVPDWNIYSYLSIYTTPEVEDIINTGNVLATRNYPTIQPLVSKERHFGIGYAERCPNYCISNPKVVIFDSAPPDGKNFLAGDIIINSNYDGENPPAGWFCPVDTWTAANGCVWVEISKI